ncbi:MAG: dihydroorotate dehydrogenase [Spirochaetales bacterium]|nr:dihydroorotate dehydrogenase [Spirochaetales bacterium]
MGLNDATRAPGGAERDPFAPDLSVRIGPLVLPNPVGVASGTFGYGEEYAALLDTDALGAIYTKAVTVEPRAGNPAPRLAETPAGLLNSIGLANPGLETFVRDKLPALRARRCRTIVNVAGATVDDYVRVVEGIEASGGVDGYELNVSCPNVKSGGMAFGTDPRLVALVTESVRRATKRALVVKLSPNVTDIAETAHAAEDAGADAVSAINTLVGMAIDVKARRPRLAMKTGGLSGPAVKPVGVAAVYRVSRAVKIPVIGLGGIMTAGDALEYLLAGADAVQVGTATFVEPDAALRVLEGIEAWMRENRVARVADIKNLLEE